MKNKFKSMIEWLEYLKYCQHCASKQSIFFEYEPYKYAANKYSIYLENLTLYITNVSNFGEILCKASIDFNTELFKFIIVKKHNPINDSILIDVSTKCSNCSNYYTQNLIAIDQITKQIVNYGLIIEIFDNEDFRIEHNYVSEQSSIIKKEKIINLSLVPTIKLSNLDFNKLNRTTLLLK